MAGQAYFQWQNEVLLKTIYPLREMKLRDFLIYYQEIDLWAEYKNKNIASLQTEYTAAMQKKTTEAYRAYVARRAYFLKPDVRLEYKRFTPLDEAELARILQLHATFISSFKYKDVRKEKYFVSERLYEWELHRNEAQRLVASKLRRINSIQEQNPSHPSLPKEQQELKKLEAALGMAQQELDILIAFLSSFDRIEARKLELFKAQEEAARNKALLAPRLTDLNDQLAVAKKKGEAQKAAALQAEAAKLQAKLAAFEATLNTAEEGYVTRFVPAGPLTAREITAWKMEEYKAGLLNKDHKQLLEMVVQRFTSQPQRYPRWLQYMVIHFSGMRYASAHGSWADPKHLLVSLRTADLAGDLKKMDEGAIQAMCQKTLDMYRNSTTAPKLARASEPLWKEKLAYYMKGLASASPSTRFQALLNLRSDEANYEVESMQPEQALEELKAYKASLPDWMWKEIVSLTQLRVSEARDPSWDKLSEEQQLARYAVQDAKYRQILDQWKLADITGWREEHDQSGQLIVTRAVCNEVAEHIQHLRGHTPPGGLTPKAPWYLKQEAEGRNGATPAAYFRKPGSAQDFTPGASILWLRFWEKQPNPWQVAHPLKTKAGDGLLPDGFAARKTPEAWSYQAGDPITRTRIVTGEKGAKVRQQQWLRWIHEATVAEVAETAEGTVVLTFETALPYEDRRLSSVGLFKHSLQEMLQEGREDDYNRSFVGYVPEGKLPVEALQEMLDWNKIRAV